jgi:glycosyltransferase involved in cell wall biosynthesis
VVEKISGDAMTAITKGLVTTIIPAYNRAPMLREAVASALAQTYRPIEIIIIDDGSTDDTLSVARDLEAAHPAEIRVIEQSNLGPGLAREAGRALARGEFIQYLDSDDLLLPDKFRLQVGGLRANPRCGIAYGYTRYRHANGRVEPTPWKGSGQRTETMFPSFLVSRWWDTPTPLYRASLCGAAGPWTDLKLEEDWEYDCRIAALGVELFFCESYVVEVRDHDRYRLCKGDALDPVRLFHRARAHELIYGHALRAGIEPTAPERQHFARALFLLARQCGAAGLARQSHALFLLARAASGEQRARRGDFRLYAAAARLLGWERAGRISCAIDRLRN